MLIFIADTLAKSTKVSRCGGVERSRNRDGVV